MKAKEEPSPVPLTCNTPRSALYLFVPLDDGANGRGEYKGCFMLRYFLGSCDVNINILIATKITIGFDAKDLTYNYWQGICFFVVMCVKSSQGQDI